MDKKELRQDPIRERILSFLSYIENNRNALYGIVAGVLAIILVGSYISTATKELDYKSSLTFGEAINNSIAGDKVTSVALFEELLSEGSNATAGNSFAYLLDYYLSISDFEKVDSLLNLDIEVTDDVLQSKIYIIQGDISLDKMEYDKSLEFYSKAAKENSTIKNQMKLKEAIVYYKTEDFNKSRDIVEGLLEIENLQYDIKNQCEKYLFMIDNSI
tara:strand:- start:275 stop:922 length:648 start_codon:yes stop_codon:yes gene_type:complete